jgi:alkanesulfonate monooxygenase SsuD/methylene tetrahydromethanopterin reductase-like flavin-dependent oxidoreductase (luciferase family)
LADQVVLSGDVKVGIQLPEIEREVRWPELRAMIRLIEDAGFDSIWVGDHLLYRAPHIGVAGPWESWTQLAAIAAITDRVEFGPLVAATSFHSPAMLAKKAITIDEISGGRLILGLGAGWNETEYRAFGFPYDHRVSRFAEAFEIIRTLVRQGEIDFDGRFYSIRDCSIVPRGPRHDGPPIMIGSRGPRMLAITAPYMDAWNAWHAWFGNDPDRLGPILEQLDAALVAAGRDPSEVERSAAALVQFGEGSGRLAGDPTRGTSEPLTGSHEEIAAGLRAYRILGINHLQLVLDPISLQSITEMAEILPGVKSL